MEQLKIYTMRWKLRSCIVLFITKNVLVKVKEKKGLSGTGCLTKVIIDRTVYKTISALAIIGNELDPEILD
jgi:hypothetical protein